MKLIFHMFNHLFGHKVSIFIQDLATFSLLLLILKARLMPSRKTNANKQPISNVRISARLNILTCSHFHSLIHINCYHSRNTGLLHCNSHKMLTFFHRNLIVSDVYKLDSLRHFLNKVDKSHGIEII